MLLLHLLNFRFFYLIVYYDKGTPSSHQHRTSKYWGVKNSSRAEKFNVPMNYNFYWISLKKDQIYHPLSKLLNKQYEETSNILLLQNEVLLSIHIVILDFLWIIYFDIYKMTIILTNQQWPHEIYFNFCFCCAFFTKFVILLD